MTNLPTIQGTEKQVAWATDVRAEMLEIVADVIAEAEADPSCGLADFGGLDELRSVLDALKSITDAGFILDRRHDPSRFLEAPTPRTRAHKTMCRRMDSAYARKRTERLEAQAKEGISE